MSFVALMFVPCRVFPQLDTNIKNLYYLFNSFPNLRAKKAGISAVSSAMYTCILLIPIFYCLQFVISYFMTFFISISYLALKKD